MKFLVKTHRRQNVPLPPETISRLLTAQREWFEEHVADGTLDCVYAFAQGGGGVFIVGVDTAEELNTLLHSAPLFPIAEFEAKALADVSVSLENAAKSVERASAVPA
jgi:muconolactone delta-isomerase